MGYTGGFTEQPSYESVCNGDGHSEALQIEFDQETVSYEDLLNVFFETHRPKKVVPQYKSAIWYHDPIQKSVVEDALLMRSIRSPQWELVEVGPAKPWWNAEEYHQKYETKLLERIGARGDQRVAEEAPRALASQTRRGASNSATARSRPVEPGMAKARHRRAQSREVQKPLQMTPQRSSKAMLGVVPSVKQPHESQPLMNAMVLQLDGSGHEVAGFATTIDKGEPPGASSCTSVIVSL